MHLAEWTGSGIERVLVQMAVNEIVANDRNSEERQY